MNHFFFIALGKQSLKIMVSIGQIIFNFLSHPAKLQTSVCLVRKKIDRNVHEYMLQVLFQFTEEGSLRIWNLRNSIRQLENLDKQERYFSIVLYDIFFSKFVPRNIKDPVVSKPKRTLNIYIRRCTVYSTPEWKFESILLFESDF